LITVLAESFDNVTPPMLPPGWLVTNAQGPPPLWVTSDSGVPNPPAYSPPNAAFIDDPEVVSDKRLDSATFWIFEEYWARATFRHNFNFEASSEDPNLGFDGGVLEYSTDAGNTFHYVPPTAFIAGGYNRTISMDRGSPIAGLRAWSGNSEGFITTVVNVAGLESGNVKLRWRMASDTSGSSEGWRVDNTVVTECHFSGTPTATPTATISASPTPTATATAAVSPSATPTATASATPTAGQRPTPLPRSRPTPVPR
jgi:hypothetical protein